MLSTQQNFLLAQLMREHRIIVLAPVMEKVKQATWEKFHMQLNGLSTNIDSAQTLQCSMGYHLYARSPHKKVSKSKKTGAGGVESKLRR